MSLKVSWTDWSVKTIGPIASYKKDCTFCTEKAVTCACTGKGHVSATIRSCASAEHKALAESMALQLISAH